METLLYVIHVLTCVAMLPIILLQSGRGGGVSGAFGGGGSGQSVFGSRGASVFLTRMTTGAAIVFMCTSLGLAYTSSRKSRSVVGDVAPIEEAQEAPKPAGDGPAPSEPAPAEPASNP
ncbi:MAG: preprotein translocase subunit SecG [Deltaproteobacteria bacterium]|nr:preprotein translocase subunit SecG [Deltaproteobacteria bacterium]